MQHDINREAAKISALPSRKIDKYEYFAGKETLPSNQGQISLHVPLKEKLLKNKQK